MSETAPISGNMAKDAVADQEKMGQDEDDEDRRQELDGLLDAPQVEDDEQDDGRDFERDFERLRRRPGKKLKMASPQETIETVIVSM